MSYIVISSSDEEDSLVNSGDTSSRRKGNMAEGLLDFSDKENDSQSSNDSVVIMEPSPKSEFRVSRNKLQLLRKEWKKKDRQTSIIVCDDSPPPNKFKIDKTRFKDLRAVVRVQLQSSPEKYPSTKINDEKKTNNIVSSGIETPPSSPILPLFELSPIKDQKESVNKRLKTETTESKYSLENSMFQVEQLNQTAKDGKRPEAHNQNRNTTQKPIKNHSSSPTGKLNQTTRDGICSTQNNLLVNPTKNENIKPLKNNTVPPVKKLNQPAEDDGCLTEHNSFLVHPTNIGNTNQEVFKKHYVSPTINGKPSPSKEVSNSTGSPNKRPCSKIESISPVKKLRQSPIKAYFTQDNSHTRPKFQPLHSPPTIPRKTISKQPLISGLLEVWHIPAVTDNNNSSSSSSSSHSPVTVATDNSVKRNELIWPAHHIIQDPDSFIRKCFSKSKMFCTYYVDAIDGLLEEKLLYELVGAVQSFKSLHMAPQQELIWLLLRDVLLVSKKRRLSYSVYTLLQEIHNSFPFSCLKMKIEWSHIQELCNNLHTTKSETKLLNTRLALSFLVTVLSTEVKSVALKTKATRVTKLFSVDFDTQIVKKITTGMKRWISDGKSNIQDDKGLSKVDSEENQFTMDFYQTLLKFVVVLSYNKEYTPIRIADELMFIYIELDSLKSRRNMLQTLQSSLVRKYLIEVLLMNYCPLLPGAMSGTEHVLSVRKIVHQDFHRNPPRRLSENGQCWSMVEVEEYVMLLAYLLQDYIRNHTTAQACHHDYTVFKEDRCKWLSHDDYSILADLNMHISELWTRCDGFLGGCTMSVRTSLFFEMMEMIV